MYEPPKRLEAAMERRGLNSQDFNVLPLGGGYTVTAVAVATSEAINDSKSY